MSATTGPDQDVGTAYVAEVRQRLASYHDLIKHCVGQLDDIQVWWRPNEPMNSIGNILLHLSGNLRQFFVSGIGGAPDVRTREEEFTERGPLPKAELLQRLDAVIAESDAVLAALPVSRLLTNCRIQNRDQSVLASILRCLTHLGGHVQEIVYISRLQLRDAYLFAGMPPAALKTVTTASTIQPMSPQDAVFGEMPAHPLPSDTTTDVKPLPALKQAPAPLITREAVLNPREELPVSDYLLSLEQEFQEEEEEGKI